MAAWILSAVGISLLAAGAPIAGILIRSTTEFAAESGAGSLAPFHAGLAAIGRGGIGIEAAAFIASAFALGATLPAVGLALKATGFGGRVAFISALIAVLSPLLLMHGRLPRTGRSSPCAALCSSPPSRPRTMTARAGARATRVRLALASVGLLAICGLSRAAAARENEAIFGAWMDLALLGGAALFVVPLGWLRQEEGGTSSPWLVGWLVLGIPLALVAGAQAGAALVPALAVLVANALSRRARPDGALRWAAMLAGAQVGLSVFALRLAPPDTTFFAAESSGEVEAGDIVVVEDLDSDEAYLLRRRIGAARWCWARLRVRPGG